MAIVTRAGKGSPLTNAELDNNFNELNAAANHATLAALRGLTPAANKLAYFTGASTMVLADLTATGLSVIAAANAAAARAAIGLVIGTDVQAQSANLAALAGLTGAADKQPYFTGAGALALADLTTYGRSLQAAVDAPAARTVLGLEEASNSDIWTGTDGAKVVTARRLYSANVSQVLTDGATITPPAGWNFHGTLGATGRTINPPSTLVAGQSGKFNLTFGGTWSLNWHATYKKVGTWPSSFAAGIHIFGYYYDGTVIEVYYSGQRAA